MKTEHIGKRKGKRENMRKNIIKSPDCFSKMLTSYEASLQEIPTVLGLDAMGKGNSSRRKEKGDEI